MNELTIAEKYALLLINAKKHCDLTSYRNSAGIVLGGLAELRSCGCIAGDGKLSISKALEKQYDCLGTLYGNVKSRPTWSMGKWLDYYCLSPTSRNVKPVVDDIVSSLANKGCIQTEIKKRFLKSRVHYTVNAQQVRAVAEYYQNAVTNCVENEETIIITQMLMLAGVAKEYFHGLQHSALKSSVSCYKKTDTWKMMKPYVNKVENFEYQNAVNTGVFYNSN